MRATINFRFISRILGMMCFVEGAILLSVILMALYYHESLMPWLVTLAAFVLCGSGLSYLGRELKHKMASRREGMLTVTSVWLLLSVLGMLPYALSHATRHGVVDAFFESISGFTTTGATIFYQVEHLDKSLLFWRSLTQWQGGMGIVVFTIALIPVFGGGASQIYNAETTGITHDRFLPRISDVARWLWGVYLLETSLLFLLLWVGPMSCFDALCHAMTCISTGGYSTRDAGVAAYHSPYTEYVLSSFMFVGSLNITLVYFALKGQPRRLLRDEEFRSYAFFIALITLVLTLWLALHSEYGTLEETFRSALFMTTSLGSSTGFVTQDVTAWGGFAWMLALLLMFVNGCAGSTSGGLKMSRFIVLLKNLYNEFKKQIHPHLLTPVLMNGRQLSVSVVHQILAFCVLYVLLLLFGALVLLADGNGFISSLSLACSAISNSGPGIGEFALSLGSATALTKFTLCFLMLAGRLEVFTVIGILTPYFWKH